MTESTEVSMSSATELLASGRRDLAVREYTTAVENLAKACELLAKQHGDTADECAEAYLWYGKALLGLSREESGVLGDGMPGVKEDQDDEDDDDEEQEENGVEAPENNDKAEADEAEAMESESDEATNKAETAYAIDMDQPGTSNGDGHDESMANLENDDDVDNLQLAWEMLDLARSIFERRVKSNPEARSLLADVHLTLGEVALESETYDKAVVDMMSCLEIQKGLYSSDDRRIAETHYQIGLANSLSSNFEEAILHFKNAVNILETRIKTLENGEGDSKAEIKELKELLPEIQEKIQDMMDYKAETLKRVREALCPSNGASDNNGTSSSSDKPKPAADISHLIKRKRKLSETEEPAAKKVNT